MAAKSVNKDLRNVLLLSNLLKLKSLLASDSSKTSDTITVFHFAFHSYKNARVHVIVSTNDARV